jgi:hypothetical protein
VSVIERERCAACNTPVFELASCAECGAPHLLAQQTADSRLCQLVRAPLEDEFAQGVDIAEASQQADLTKDTQRRHIVGRATRDGVWSTPFDPRTGALLDCSDERSVMLRLSDASACRVRQR